MCIEKYNVFWDLDGVIFEYNVEDYIGLKPKYAEKGYFSNRPINQSAFDSFYTMYRSENVDVHILSRGATRLSKKQRITVINDKYENIKNIMPWFNEKRVIITEDTKIKAAEKYLNRKLCKTDILIDDFNENLKSWNEAGGTAIKYLNGINSAHSYDGTKIVNSFIIAKPEEESFYEPLGFNFINH